MCPPPAVSALPEASPQKRRIHYVRSMERPKSRREHALVIRIKVSRSIWWVLVGELARGALPFPGYLYCRSTAQRTPRLQPCPISAVLYHFSEASSLAMTVTPASLYSFSTASMLAGSTARVASPITLVLNPSWAESMAVHFTQ